MDNMATPRPSPGHTCLTPCPSSGLSTESEPCPSSPSPSASSDPVPQHQLRKQRRGSEMMEIDLRLRCSRDCCMKTTVQVRMDCSNVHWLHKFSLHIPRVASRQHDAKKLREETELLWWIINRGTVRECRLFKLGWEKTPVSSSCC